MRSIMTDYDFTPYESERYFLSSQSYKAAVSDNVQHICVTQEGQVLFSSMMLQNFFLYHTEKDLYMQSNNTCDIRLK
jgi:hypothetical protein